MQYPPKNTKLIVGLLVKDLPRIILCLQMMEVRLHAMDAIMEQQKEKLRVMALADELLAKIVTETPDYEIQFVPK